MGRPHLLPVAAAPAALLVAMACSRGADRAAVEGPDRADASAEGADGAPGGDAMTDARSGDDDGGAKGTLFAFVGSRDGKIRSYVVDAASGAFRLEAESDAGQNPSFLAFDPPRRRVVATDEAAGLVRSFAFDPGSGALTEVASRSAGGAGTTHVSFDPTSRWVMVANYTGGNMAIFPIDAAGVLGEAADTKDSGPKSHWAGTNPSGTHVFVPALGADIVASYRLNATTGALTGNGSASVPAGAGPRHLAFHPNEAWAYTMNELAVTVTSFAFDKSAGTLSPKETISALPAGVSADGVTGAGIAVHPSGRHVYASTRGENAIAHFSVNASDGTLTLVAAAKVDADQPRSFGIDPGGTLLYAGNENADHVVGFRIDKASGALTPLGKTVDVPGPTFVGLAVMP